MGATTCIPEVLVRSDDERTVITCGAWEMSRWADTSGGDVLVRDIDAAARLGFAEPRMIRKLIKRIWPENQGVHVRSTVERTSMPRGGERTTTVNEFWLTEAQLLKVVARSETPVAEAILDDMIRVYMAVRRALAAPPAPPIVAPTVATPLLPARRRVPAQGLAAIITEFDGQGLATVRLDDGRIGWIARTLGPIVGIAPHVAINAARKLRRVGGDGADALARLILTAETRQVLTTITRASVGVRGIEVPMPVRARAVLVIFAEGVQSLPIDPETRARLLAHLDAEVLPVLAPRARASDVTVRRLRPVAEQLPLPPAPMVLPQSTELTAQAMDPLRVPGTSEAEVAELLGRTRRYAVRVAVEVPDAVWATVAAVLPIVATIVRPTMENTLALAVLLRDW